jgi:hypothetical protein
MRKTADGLYLIVITLWVGGMWAVGYLVAPALFAHLPADRALAGALAGRMFDLIEWVGMGSATYLLLYLLVRRGLTAMRTAVFWLVVLMLLATLASHFGIQPLMAQFKTQAALSGAKDVLESVARDRFRTWHGVSSVLYLIQSLLGLLLVLLQDRGRR